MATEESSSQGVPQRWPTLSAQGIKSLRDECSIEVAPLTLLAGANSSGKSSVLQPLLMVKQTLESPYDPGPLQISGENTSFASVREMLWRAPGQARAQVLKAGYSSQSGESVTVSFKPAARGLDLDEMTIERGDGQTSILRMDSRQADLFAAVDPHLRSVVGANFPEAQLDISRERSFFQVSMRDPRLPLYQTNPFMSAANSLLHLPGLRGAPQRFYPATEVGDNFPGVFSPYVASVLNSWGLSGDSRLESVSRQMSQLGLSWRVRAQRLDDTRVELRVGRLPAARRGGAHDLVNIADVGLGVSQTLPLLVALLVAKPGQIVYVEQPEIHLHPRAQVALAGVLLEASRRGVLVIAETHSHLLLRGIQAAVAAGPASDYNNLVRLHWFSRSPTGVTEVDTSALDTTGAYGDWPIDFAEVELAVEGDYLDAAMRALP